MGSNPTTTAGQTPATRFSGGRRFSFQTGSVPVPIPWPLEQVTHAVDVDDQPEAIRDMRHSGGKWRAEFAIRAPNAPRKAAASELRCRSSDVVCAVLCKSDSAVVHGSAAGGLAANARPIGTRPRSNGDILRRQASQVRILPRAQEHNQGKPALTSRNTGQSGVFSCPAVSGHNRPFTGLRRSVPNACPSSVTMTQRCLG